MGRRGTPFDHDVDEVWSAYQQLCSDDEDEQLEGFERFFAMWEDTVTGFAIRSVRSQANKFPAIANTILNDLTFHCENVSQEAWVVVFRKIGVFETPDRETFIEKIRNWLSAIVANIAREHVRRVSRWHDNIAPLSDQEDDVLHERILGTQHEDGPEALLQNKTDIRRLLEAIRKLTPDEQEVIIQRHLYRRRYRAIAKMMGRSEAALRVMHNRVMHKLRELLGDDLEGFNTDPE